MAIENASKDQNRIPTLIAVSSADGISPIKVYADPSTHRLLVSSSGAITPTTVNGNTITSGTGTLTLGSATLNAGPGGTLGSSAFASLQNDILFDHFTDIGNVTTGETDLYSDTIPAGQLSANGQKIESEYGGTFVSSGTATREVKIYFGGTVIFDTGALTLGLSSAWTVYTCIMRVSASIIRYSISFTTEGAALSAYTAVGEVTGLTLSGTQIIKITGQAGGVGAATNDIVAKIGYVEWKSAA